MSERSEEAQEQIERTGQLVDRVKPLLAGHELEVQGAALAELTLMWLMDHPAAARDGIREFHLRSVLGFVKELKQLDVSDGRKH